VQHLLIVGPGVEVEDGPRAVEVEQRDPGVVAQPAGVGVDDQLVTRHGVLVAQRRTVAGGPDLAVRDDHQVVAEPLDQFELVAREEHRHPGRGPVAQHVDHHLDGERVEARERLVEHQHLGLVHQGGGDLGALLVAEGELLELLAGAFAQAEPLEEPGRAAFGVGAAQAVQPAEVDDLVVHGHRRVEAAFLGHVAEAVADRSGQRPAVEGHLTGVGGQHAEDDPHGGGLAGAVRADEPGQPAARHGERDVLQNRPVPEAAADGIDVQHGGHSRRR
jgi:hypothetical protein